MVITETRKESINRRGVKNGKSYEIKITLTSIMTIEYKETEIKKHELAELAPSI